MIGSSANTEEIDSSKLPGAQGSPSRWRQRRDWLDENGDSPRLWYLPQLVALILVFVVLQKYFLKRCELDQPDYFAFFVAPHLLMSAKLVLFLGVVATVLISSRARLGWSELEPEPRLRLLIGALTLALAWAFSLYAPNYFYGRAHVLDRALLVAFAGLSLWRPVWLAAFVAQFIMIVGQFEQSTVNYSATDKRILLSLLILFIAFMFVRAASKKFPARLYFLVALAMVTANYFCSGLAKARLAWWSHEDISYLFLAATDNGWWGFAGEPARGAAARAFHVLTPLMIVFTLIVELGAPMVFLNRRLALPMIAGWIALHVGIFAASGIFFWKWILMDGVWIFLLLQDKGWPSLDGVPKWLAPATGLALVALSPLITRIHFLGWYDTPLSAVFRFDGVGESGAVYELPPGAFEPYDFPFAQGRFSHLLKDGFPVTTYGAINDVGTLNKLLTLREPIDRAAWSLQRELTEKDMKRNRELDEFLRAFIKRTQSHPKPPLWTALSAPHHIWTGPITDREYKGQEPLKAIRIRVTETFFINGKGTLARDEPVREITAE